MPSPMPELTNDYLSPDLVAQLDAAAAGITEPCEACNGVGFLTKTESGGTGESGWGRAWNERCVCNGTGITHPYPDAITWLRTHGRIILHTWEHHLDGPPTSEPVITPLQGLALLETLGWQNGKTHSGGMGTPAVYWARHYSAEVHKGWYPDNECSADTADDLLWAMLMAHSTAKE